MKTTKNQNDITLGVDTGKHQLDVYFTVSNDDKGISEAIKALKKHHPTRIVIEATGRLEHAFILACSKANLPVVVANPAQVKKFAGAIGRLAKTDELDARLIAHYGEAIKPDLSELKPDMMRRMSDLLSRRKQLLGMQTMGENCLKIMPKALVSSIKD